ncbi:MAG: type II toxin-antitoxin system YhaV family toxin [Acetobacteraceae bacterium]|nr:type II toxin-antitoxin system YhaV family toxin [Acetobacteraceae bacterium]
MAAQPGLVVNGWTILVHKLFVDQIAATVTEIERARSKDPINFSKKNCAKRLAAILKLAFEDIPHNPANPIYRQGGTIGPAFTHWYRAKFFQQYRLFFRYDLKARIIIYAWVNDDDTKRAYDSRTDAYAVFGKMLANGNPPNDWASLMAAAQTGATVAGLAP